MSLSVAIPVTLSQLATFVAGGAFGAVLILRRPGVELTRPVPSRRIRVGRLPLPPRVSKLTPDEEPALIDVNDFVDRLAALPFEVWLRIGRSLIEDRSTVGPRATAFAILEATIGAHGLGIAAWYTRDAVETSAFVATQSAAGWTKEDRRVFAAAHAGAETAGLALLARDKLSATDFTLLSGPFASLMLVETNQTD